MSKDNFSFPNLVVSLITNGPELPFHGLITYMTVGDSMEGCSGYLWTGIEKSLHLYCGLQTNEIIYEAEQTTLFE